MVDRDERKRKRLAFLKEKLEEEKETAKIVREQRKVQAERTKLRRERAKGGLFETFTRGSMLVARGTIKGGKALGSFAAKAAEADAKSRARVKRHDKKKKMIKKSLRKTRKKQAKISRTFGQERTASRGFFDIV